MLLSYPRLPRRAGRQHHKHQRGVHLGLCGLGRDYRNSLSSHARVVGDAASDSRAALGADQLGHKRSPWDTRRYAYRRRLGHGELAGSGSRQVACGSAPADAGVSLRLRARIDYAQRHLDTECTGISRGLGCCRTRRAHLPARPRLRHYTPRRFWLHTHSGTMEISDGLLSKEKGRRFQAPCPHGTNPSWVLGHSFPSAG